MNINIFTYTRHIVLLILIEVVFIFNVNAISGRDPYTYFFDETFGDFSEEIVRARDEGKTGVLLFFEMDECPYCHKMKQTILNQPAVQEYYKKHFLIFSVDIEGDIEIHDFMGKPITQKEFAVKVNRVRATPVFAFYDLTGKQVVRYTGTTKDTDDFILLGEFVVNGIYKNMRFSRYKRHIKKQKMKNIHN